MPAYRRCTAVVRWFFFAASPKGIFMTDMRLSSRVRGPRASKSVHAGSQAFRQPGRRLIRRGSGPSLRTAHVNEGAMDPRFIDDLARRLSAAVSQGFTAVRRDLEENFKAVLQAGLAKLDLVTRQEFDVQAGVLRRTREKLEALEARLSEFEKGVAPRAALPESRPPA